MSGSDPGREPAVEDADVRETRPAEHPPGPGRAEARPLVEDDDRRVVVETALAQACLQAAEVGEGVSPATAGWIGEVCVEVEVVGAADVRCRVESGAVRCAGAHGEVPLDVEDDDLPEGRGELAGGDEGRHADSSAADGRSERS